MDSDSSEDTRCGDREMRGDVMVSKEPQGLFVEDRLLRLISTVDHRAGRGVPDYQVGR